MPIVVTLVAPPSTAIPAAAIEAVREVGGGRAEATWLEADRACDVVIGAATGSARSALRRPLADALCGFAVDWAVQADGRRRKRLLVSDMDSTITEQECIDEIADFAGLRGEVAGITRRAMAGELDFVAALQERVALLAGLGEDVLGRVMADRITVTPGAATLVATMRRHGAYTVLVSGGFTFCAADIAARLGFDTYRANRLIVESGRLAGRVGEPVLDRAAKLESLLAACSRLGIEPDDALGLGDGANDLGLIETAGLGVAYRAKPILANAANALIEHGDLTAALFFQGYRREEFALA